GRPGEGPARARLDAAHQLRAAGADDGGRGPGAGGVKILVTGADGFVGRWLVRRLLDDGREVVGAVRPLERPAPGGGGGWDLTPDERDAVRWLSLELTDQESVRRCAEQAYDAVVQLAALEAWRRVGLRVVVARPFAHTGPGQDARFVVPGLAQRLKLAQRTGAPVVKVGNLEPVREFLHVRDVVDAYVRLLGRGQPGETYNVASGQGLPLEALFFRLAGLVGVRAIPEA